MEVNSRKLMCIILGLFVFAFRGVRGITDQNDFKILSDFRNGLKNPELLKWPATGNDPCGPPLWPHVFCSNGRVSQIQVQSLGLEGPLPQNLNQLEKLENVGLQKNKFNGKLPTFSGLSNLQFAFLAFNNFDTIPSDFFHGLTNIRVLALDGNPFNQSTGWTIPSELVESSQLVNFSCSGCNLLGPLPDFFGKFPSLTLLTLANNRLTGEIPSTFRDSMLSILWLNDQDGGGMTGPIDVIATMVGLTQVWLHGNQFTGSIPDDIGRLTSMTELNLNKNRLVGLIPTSLADMNLQLLDLSNNMFMGPIPKFKAAKVTYESNSFCQSDPGEQCSSQVSTLLDFLHDVNYPGRLASQWTGNDPCSGPWWGITCNSRKEVSVINLQKLGLNGMLSPSLGNLSSVVEIHLEGNNIHGVVPTSLAQLTSLRLLNLSGNDFEPPLPRFNDGVKVAIDGNGKLQTKAPPSPVAEPPHLQPPPPSNPPQSPSDGPKSPTMPPQSPSNTPQSPSIPPQSPSKTPKSPSNIPQSPSNTPQSPSNIPQSPSNTPQSPSNTPQSPSNGTSSGYVPQPSANSPPSSDHSSPSSPTPLNEHASTRNSTKSRVLIIVAAAAGSTVSTVFALLLVVYCIRKKKVQTKPPSGVVVHPKDPSVNGDMVKIAIADHSASDVQTGISSLNRVTIGGLENAQVIEAGNLVISLQVLRKVTNDFAQENELGRGGFGVVYKGELEDGTKLAVKRMLVASISNKALDEFQSEIAVLSMVRHRHLVSLLGYSVEGDERLLVYEYMPKGALSRHLFRWKNLGLEPLSWARRLNIALDVARGLEYLHALANQRFIHRDLKSANILLDDDFRAKVADFGLVKLAPDCGRSLATRLAGTFGYLAPEYAVTGKITTKVDVFSFGVVLMELLTGLAALDEKRPEENRYLCEWFWQIKSNRSSLIASIDPALDVKEDIYETIYAIAELAGHCTLRDPNHRPDMGHAVNVLVQLVEKWKPYEETEQFSGISMSLPLTQMLRGWQEEADLQDVSGASLDSKGSIPTKPSGFADSFTSADAR